MRKFIAALILFAVGIPSMAVADKFDKWQTQCGSGCQTFTLEEVYKWEDGEPFLMRLEVTPEQQLEVSALVSREEYEKYYTLDPPTEFRRGGKQFVGARQFFSDSPATISVDGQHLQTVQHKDGGHMADQLETVTLNEFREGRKVKVSGDFCAAPGCAKQSITFSLIGFSAAYAARASNETTDMGSASDSSQDPVTAVADALAGNRYGIQRQHLRTKGNPFGQGIFVYVPKVEIADYERLFVWFVNKGQPVALNGPSISVTKNAKRPLEMGYEFWEDTGVNSDNVTKRGLDTVYRDR